MKIVITITAACLLATAAPGATKKKPDAKSTGTPGLDIPKDATRNEDGTYSWTDKDGKKWLYAKTPFGVMRSEAASAPAADATPARASAELVRLTNVTDKGETIQFERTTPFGPVRWEKKKTELSDEERSIVDQKTAKSQ